MPFEKPLPPRKEEQLNPDFPASTGGQAPWKSPNPLPPPPPAPPAPPNPAPEPQPSVEPTSDTRQPDQTLTIYPSDPESAPYKRDPNEE